MGRYSRWDGKIMNTRYPQITNLYFVMPCAIPVIHQTSGALLACMRRARTTINYRLTTPASYRIRTTITVVVASPNFTSASSKVLRNHNSMPPLS
jgi:hypothetical protein